MEDYETVLLVKPEVFIFKIPPRTTNRGYKAADWKLDAPDFTGRMRVVSLGKKCFIKLEDKNSGELFAQAPVDNYPGNVVEAVMDSSRYFVLRIEDDNGRAAFIGIGFADRADSFDLNVALQDHFKWIQKNEEIEKGLNEPESKSNLDLGFKDGQTITINMNIGKKSGSSKPRPKTSGLLPPPPGSVKIPPPISKTADPVLSQESANASSNASADPPSQSGLLLDFDLQPAKAATNETSVSQNSLDDPFGDFTTASSTSSNTTTGKAPSSENWANF